MSDMIRLKMETKDMVADNVQKIAALFPNCVTEKETVDGKLEKGINWKMLKQMLKGKVIDGEEAYEFTWVGKKAAVVEANTPIRKTLRPCKEESKNWDTTENLYIEGDNLEALKLLQESYLGKVKMIYIDPPYNTGHDFVYPDSFKMGEEEYNGGTKYFAEDGTINFSRENSKQAGRYHSDWCSMMYSRLLLARHLLAEDGVIFISIGDEEVDSLKKISDEVFGEDNFRNQIVIRRGAKSVQAQFDTWDKLGKDYEYILLYSMVSTYRFPKQVRALKEVRGGTWNNHWRGTDRPTMRYPLLGITPETGQWRWGKDRSDIAVSNYRRMISDIGCDNPTQKQIDNWYANQPEGTDLLRLSTNGKPEHYIPPTSTTLLNSSWMDLLVGASSEINALFDKKVFDTAKLTESIKRMLKFVSNDAIILDFFSGSATTAHAVMQLNAEDGGQRKFIMVQLPEPTDKKSEAYKAGYKNICEIGKERIRRAGDKIVADNADKEGIVDLDIGFRVLKVDSSNMNDVYYGAEDYSQELLLQLEDNIKSDRSDLDLLFGCIVDWGLELSCPYSSTEIEGYTVHNYNDGDLIACFAKDIPESVIKAIAKMEPMRAVFRDSGFADSPAKINVTEIFKRLAPDTEIRVL